MRKDAPVTESSPSRAVERLAFFSDAVFAIAITLLALDIRGPETLSSNTNAALLEAMRALGPTIAAYVLSFAVIAQFWMAHHRSFRAIERVDGRLVGINLAFLGFVALVPFPTSVLARHGDLSAAPVVYALFMIGLAALSTLLWVYAALVAGLVAPAVSPDVARRVGYRAAVVPLVFVASIPIALISPFAAEVAWLLIFPVQAVVSRQFGLERFLSGKP